MPSDIITEMRPSRLPPSGLLPSLLLLPLVAGCAASDEADGGDPLRAAMMEPGTMSRLTGADHGIELHKWLVDDDVAAFAAAVQTHADRDVLPGPVRERWARNGFRLVRVPLDELGGMLTTLGGASMNLTGWYGQNIPYPGFSEPSGVITSALLSVFTSLILYVMFKRRDWI